MHVSCLAVNAAGRLWIEAGAMSGLTGSTSDSEFQAALSSAELFRQLLESAPDAIVGIGRDGPIAFVNAQTEALFGYARATLIGELVEKLVPERYHGGHRSGYFTDPRTRPMGDCPANCV